MGDNVLSLCLSFPIHGKRRVNLVYTELGRAGQEQDPFGFPLKLPIRDFFTHPSIWGHSDVGKPLLGFLKDAKT